MDEWSGCSCPLCKVEQALIEQFAEKQTARQYYDVARRSPILSGFPTALALLPPRARNNNRSGTRRFVR